MIDTTHPSTLSPATVLLAALALALLAPTPSSAATFRVDGASGSDGVGCGGDTSPCASIQQAVDLASSGDTILVAEGTYVDDVDCLGEAAVVCIYQKELSILGGFSSGSWSLPDPAANTTVIDGQNSRRGLLVRRGGSGAHLPTTSLRIEGFTVRDGRATGAPAVGGGLKANFSSVVLRDMVFEGNVVAADAGGLAGGGGAAVQSDADNIATVILERVRFQANQVTGGGGTGGAALGGGLLTDFSTVEGLDLHFENNSVTGGASSSAGKDALGGAAAFSFGTTGTIQSLTALGNSATAGSATSTGGSAFGGALFLEGAASPAEEETSLTVVDSTFSGNSATGGAASSAGGGAGGAIDVFAARITLERSRVIGNSAEGGAQGSSKANAGGGGVFIEWPFPSTPPLNVVRNSVIADNTIDGSQGGGGGLRLLGARASVVHTTVVDNRILGAGFGNGILVGPRFATSQESELTLGYSILADHTVPSGAEALYVQASDSLGIGSTADLSAPSHFVGNADDTNQGDANSGTFTGYPGSNLFDPTPSDFFVDPASGDYHVDGSQPPTDAAGGSSEPLDLDGASRSGTPDMGADEFGALAYGLSVGKAGVGTGTVTSSPAGVDCGADCFEHYAEGTSVGLTATPDSGFYFTGWSGDADCGDGSVLMSQERSCTAQFEDQPKACTVGDDALVLTGKTVNNTVTEQACDSITAGPSYTVGSSGTVTFEAPSIILRNGFVVEGTFTAIGAVP